MVFRPAGTASSSSHWTLVSRVMNTRSTQKRCVFSSYGFGPYPSLCCTLPMALRHSKRGLTSTRRALCTCIGILLLLSMVKEWPWPGRASSEGGIERILLASANLFCFFPKLLVAVLPTEVHAWAWFTVRLTSRSADALWSRVAPKHATLDAPTPRQRPQSSAEGYDLSIELRGLPPPLARLLIWDILLLVSKHLHYADVVSLSMASKQMRNAILPPVERVTRLRQLKMHTLDRVSGLECDICQAPICPVQSITPLTP
jgi:hypothetical protein